MEFGFRFVENINISCILFEKYVEMKWAANEFSRLAIHINMILILSITQNVSTEVYFHLKWEKSEIVAC